MKLLHGVETGKSRHLIGLTSWWFKIRFSTWSRCSQQSTIVNKVQLNKVQLNKVQLNKVQLNKVQLNKVQLNKVQPW